MRVIRRLAFGLLALSVISGVIVSGHLYLLQRMVYDIGFDPEVEGRLAALIWFFALLLVAQPIAERTLRPPLARLIAWPASLWMGVFFLSFVGFAASDLLFWLLRSLLSCRDELVVGSGVQLSIPAVERSIAVLAWVAAASALGLRSAFAGPQDRRVEIVLRRWPAGLDGYRIVQISDVHIGPILGRAFAQTVSRRVNALQPDLVAVTGDLVDGAVSKLRDEVAPFASLRARDGVFFVTGNHDHYSDADAWARQAAELGMRVLRNESLVIGEGDCAFELAGVDDHRGDIMPGSAGGEDLGAALASRVEASGSGQAAWCRPLLLLAHDPSTFKRAHAMNIDLQLSGHTHGGQIWPFHGLVRLAIPFVAGLYRRGDAQLYVSRGTGFWGPPMRLGAPAEITELVIRCPSLT